MLLWVLSSLRRSRASQLTIARRSIGLQHGNSYNDPQPPGGWSHQGPSRHEQHHFHSDQHHHHSHGSTHTAHSGRYYPRNPSYRLSRDELREFADQTLQTLDNGFYYPPGTTIGEDEPYNLVEKIDNTDENTGFYPPDDEVMEKWVEADLGNGEESNAKTKTKVIIGEYSTLVGARKLHAMVSSNQDGKSNIIGVLNFASAKKPGGGFINGAQAQVRSSQTNTILILKRYYPQLQEESIARASTLYPSLLTPTAQQFYEYYANDPDNAYYTHAMVYSPAVVLIRNDRGDWKPPIDVDVLTSAAVNAGDVRKQVQWEEEMRELRERVRNAEIARREEMDRIRKEEDEERARLEEEEAERERLEQEEMMKEAEQAEDDKKAEKQAENDQKTVQQGENDQKAEEQTTEGPLAVQTSTEVSDSETEFKTCESSQVLNEDERVVDEGAKITDGQPISAEVDISTHSLAEIKLLDGGTDFETLGSSQVLDEDESVVDEGAEITDDMPISAEEYISTHPGIKLPDKGTELKTFNSSQVLDEDEREVDEGAETTDDCPVSVEDHVDTHPTIKLDVDVNVDADAEAALSPDEPHSPTFSPIMFATDPDPSPPPFPSSESISALLDPSAVEANIAQVDPLELAEAQIVAEMRERIARLLFLFHQRGARHLILGSFGTGVFQNSVEMVAGIFREFLCEEPDADSPTSGKGKFKGAFDTVMFAILGGSTVRTFERVFEDAEGLVVDDEGEPGSDVEEMKDLADHPPVVVPDDKEENLENRVTDAVGGGDGEDKSLEERIKEAIEGTNGEKENVKSESSEAVEGTDGKGENLEERINKAANLREADAQVDQEASFLEIDTSHQEKQITNESKEEAVEEKQDDPKDASSPQPNETIPEPTTTPSEGPQPSKTAEEDLPKPSPI